MGELILKSIQQEIDFPDSTFVNQIEMQKQQRGFTSEAVPAGTTWTVHLNNDVTLLIWGLIWNGFLIYVYPNGVGALTLFEKLKLN